MRVSVYQALSSTNSFQTPAKIKGGFVSAETSRFLTLEGGLLQCTNLSVCRLVAVPEVIVGIAATSHAALLWSSSGRVYAIGTDPAHAGLFATPECYSLPQPVLVYSLAHIEAVQVSIANTHCALVDKQGSLYTWGSAEFGELGGEDLYVTKASPALVSLECKAQAVACGPTCTCICTQGGYIYIYGYIGSTHGVPNYIDRGSPFTLPDPTSYCVTNVCCGIGYIAFVTEDGHVFVIDECMDPIQLPTATADRVVHVVPADMKLYGVTSNKLLYEWKATKRMYRDSCALAHWRGQTLQVSTDFMLLNSNELALAAVDEVILEKKNAYEAYRRSEFAQRLMASVSDVSDTSMSKLRTSFSSILSVSPILKDDLSRLYSVGDTEKTIETIIRCRLEAEQRTKFYNAFKPILYPLLEQSFDILREFAGLNWARRLGVTLSAFLNKLDIVHERFKVTKTTYAFALLKTCLQDGKMIDLEELLKRNNAIKRLVHVCVQARHRLLFNFFLAIKDLELHHFQQTAAVMWIRDLFGSKLNKGQTLAFVRWKRYVHTLQRKEHSVLALTSTCTKIQLKAFYLLKQAYSQQKVKMSVLKRLVAATQRTVHRVQPAFNLWTQLVAAKNAFDGRKISETHLGLKLLLGMFASVSHELLAGAFRKLSYKAPPRLALGLRLLHTTFNNFTVHAKRSGLHAIKSVNLCSRQFTQTEGSEALTLLPLKLVRILEAAVTDHCHDCFTTLKNFNKMKKHKHPKLRNLAKRFKESKHSSYNREMLCKSILVRKELRAVAQQTHTQSRIQMEVCPVSSIYIKKEKNKLIVSSSYGILEKVSRKLVPLTTPKKKNESKPPWKPTSIATNFEVTPKRVESAERRKTYVRGLKYRHK